MVVMLYSMLLDYKQKSSMPLVSTAMASPVSLSNLSSDQLACLYDNIYFEARNQPIAGQLAVMFVTLNRVKDDRFPDTICEVVYQGSHKPSWKDPEKLIPIKHKCQFSWYCDGLSDQINNAKAYEQIVTLVKKTLITKKIIDITDGALFYHADYVKPSWAKTKKKTVEIEDHIFYRWEG